MAEKHVVVQGAQCMCNFGTAPDKLKVLTNDKDFANDSQGSKKPIATTKDIGTTFEKNMFGSCSKMNNKPCNAVVQSWSGFYPDTILSNGGKVLLEDSKASCPIGGADCIRVIQHGQQAEPSQKNIDNSSKEVQGQLNPMANMITDQGSFEGIEVATR
ncbi:MULTISPECIES: DUF4280 domain-containing protein [Sphingobacterium]|uniref:DUF4280 domain-containing protein n=1 Tax=Sphingobacterium ginsenosidimutans TaxID=687845 RepID=A0ABP8A9H9_9SPHI|nr:DUF4280 domain-containing protein [Sphingobacterium sp. E70]ULT25617.1 DUF4280 domain-containing protein [Sphingobacterium sp. E70]